MDQTSLKCLKLSLMSSSDAAAAMLIRGPHSPPANVQAKTVAGKAQYFLSFINIPTGPSRLRNAGGISITALHRPYFLYRLIPGNLQSIH